MAATRGIAFLVTLSVCFGLVYGWSFRTFLHVCCLVAQTNSPVYMQSVMSVIFSDTIRYFGKKSNTHSCNFHTEFINTCILHQIMRRTEGKYLGSTRQDTAHKLLIFHGSLIFSKTHITASCRMIVEQF